MVAVSGCIRRSWSCRPRPWTAKLTCGGERRDGSIPHHMIARALTPPPYGITTTPSVTMSLPPPFLSPPTPLYKIQTLLHELCHAAAWVIDHKSNPPHGAHFWAWANRAKEALPGVPVTTCHSYKINYKYRYVCVGSSASVGGGLGVGGGGGGSEGGSGGGGDGPGAAGGQRAGCGAEIGRHSKSIDVAKQVRNRVGRAGVLLCCLPWSCGGGGGGGVRVKRENTTHRLRWCREGGKERGRVMLLIADIWLPPFFSACSDRAGVGPRRILRYSGGPPRKNATMHYSYGPARVAKYATSGTK